ncbi:MAG: DUF4345 family protein, partial [Gammaproteobacteria bacterium]
SRRIGLLSRRLVMDIAILAVAVGFTLMGLVALARPASIGQYFDVQFASVDGRNEVRAVYGGFGLAIGLALWLATQVPELRAGVIACVALALAGMAAGRLFSALLERSGFWPWVFCGIEAAAAALLAWTLGGAFPSN